MRTLLWVVLLLWLWPELRGAAEPPALKTRNPHQSPRLDSGAT
ncbi:hypothetical protein [Archangium violaceum]